MKCSLEVRSELLSLIYSKLKAITILEKHFSEGLSGILISRESVGHFLFQLALIQLFNFHLLKSLDGILVLELVQGILQDIRVRVIVNDCFSLLLGVLHMAVGQSHLRQLGPFQLLSCHCQKRT